MEKLLKILLFLIVPAMVLGQIVSIEIQNFKYEVSASEFLIVVTIGLFIIYRIIKRDLNFYLPMIVVFFVLYIFLSAFSVLWANDTSRVIIALRVELYHILVLILALNLIKNRQDLKYLFYSLTAAAVLISGQLIYQVYSLGGFFTQFIPERNSIITPVGPWVTVSAIIVLTLPMIYALGLLNMFKNKVIAVAMFVITVLAAMASILTLGKSELMALVVGAFFFNYKYFYSRIKSFSKIGDKTRIVKLFIGLVIVLTVVSFVLAPFIGGLADRFGQIFNDQNTKFRAREYQLTLLAVKDNFFTGVGAGNLKIYFRNNGLCQCYTEASNYLTHFFGELGIVGFLLFVGGGLSIARSLHSLNNLVENDNLFLLSFKTSLIVFLVNGFFEATIAGLNYGIVFWMIVGGLLAFEKIIRLGKESILPADHSQAERAWFSP